MVAVLTKTSVRTGIGEMNRKISELELQKKKICEKITQLRQERNRMILKLRTLPPPPLPPSQTSPERGKNQKGGDDVSSKPDNIPRSSSDDLKEVKVNIHNDDPIIPCATNYSASVCDGDKSNNNNHDDINNVVKSAEAQTDKEREAIVDDVDEFWTAFAADFPTDDWDGSESDFCDALVVAMDDARDEKIVIISEVEEGERSAPIKDISDTGVTQILQDFQFTAPEPRGLEKSRPVQFKTPDPLQIPILKKPISKPKSKQGKLFENQHIHGEHKRNKPVNSKANFDQAQYYLLRPSGRRGALARGRGLDEVKCVTKKPLAYSGTGWRNNGVEGEAVFVVTGKHDQVRQAVEPVHLDGKAEVTSDGKVMFEGQLYSQLSQTQAYF